jgi:quinol-cytochrome oxidoreductase complex cytochrome b subunit
MEQKKSDIVGRVLKSIFPSWGLERRESKRMFLNNFALHFRPSTVSRSALRFTLSWGLGGMAALLVAMQLCTGILLKFAYEPFPQLAYQSVQTIRYEIPFGGLIRNIHYWSANILVLVVFLHFMRVFFTGAFHNSRRFNWVFGLGLFGMVLGANFTGYLLPYDQLAYWAVTICIGLLDYFPIAGPWIKELIHASSDVGPESLKTFYTFHTTVIPVFLITAMAFHFWRVRKAGGLAIPKNQSGEMDTISERLPSVPYLLVREASVAFALTALVMVLSVLFDAPLGDPANPGLSPDPTKAPWYFAGLQELLLHFHPFFSVAVLPSVILLALVAMPYRNYHENTSGIWFSSSEGRRSAALAATFSAATTIILVILDEYAKGILLSRFEFSPIVESGFIPLAICLVAVFSFLMMLRKKIKMYDNETVQALFTIVFTAYVFLTLINVGLRGKGMALVFGQ